GNRMLIDDALARLPDGVKWTYETERSSTALTLVTGGVGVSILPRSLVETHSGDHVRWQFLSDPGLARPVGFISRVGREDSAAVSRLKTAIRTVCAKRV
ncbi:MAG: LysR substrate-binding domain-containing protein, partial [Pseudomonadota bacterium]